MAVEGERVIRRAYRAFAERDLEMLTRLAHDSIEIFTVTGLLAGRTDPYRGHAGLAEYMDDLSGTWKRIELEAQQFNALDDGRVLVFGRVRAWHETGFIDASNAWIWNVSDGRVVSVQVLADPNDARGMLADR